MSLIFVLWGMLAWLAVSLVLLAVLHGRCLAALWREPILAYPVLIVESDDWGVGPPADGAILAQIARSLGEIRDETGHPAVMTLGVVLGSPDGAEILASDCQHYLRRTLAEPGCETIVEAMRQGCEAGVFSLQRHGLEHCWPAALLARARVDKMLRTWLADPAARSETLPPALQSRWVDSSILPSRALPAAEINQAVEEEAELFIRIFGSVPAVAVPNTFVWDETVEAAWAATGVQCVVTPGKQFAGRDAQGKLLPPLRVIYNGQRSSSGVIYLVRNDYFEPIRGHRAEDVWRVVANKTSLGRPTLLETHRESFIAAGSTGQTALAELERALRGALERYPKLRFLGTKTLAQAMVDPNNPLVKSGRLLRIFVFLRRLRAEPEFKRLLQLTGLEVLLWLLEMALASVTGDRSDRAPT